MFGGLETAVLQEKLLSIFARAGIGPLGVA
jgi:hypothetical protein